MIPPKGTTARAAMEFGVRWRQMGRAIAKDFPLLGAFGRAVGSLPLIRDFYPAPKTVRRWRNGA